MPTNTKYDDPSVYDKYLNDSSESDCVCNDCGCCAPGLVSVEDANGCSQGCLTPNDAEAYQLSQKVVPEGYVRTYNPVTGEYLGDLTVADSIQLVTFYNSLPIALNADISITNVLEFGEANGTAQASVSGGTGPYTITWTDMNDVVVNPSALEAGSYIFRVVDDAGAEVVEVFTITQPNILALTVETKDESSPAAADGIASALVTGGVQPYSYNWTDNLGTPIGQTTQTATGLTAATYRIYVTDANGIVISDLSVIIG